MREIKFRAYTEISNEVLGMKYDVPHNYNDTVMQFTGLLDRNGVEIYEGDVIRCYTKSNEEVVYNHKVELPSFYREIWSRKKGIENGEYWEAPAEEGEMCNGVEVIGNIYENPEL